MSLGVSQVLALLAGLVVGWLVARSVSRNAAREKEAAWLREIQERERTITLLRRDVDDWQGRTREMAEVSTKLPDLVRQMFEAPGRRGVGQAAVRMLELFLHPEQCAVFTAWSPTQNAVLDQDFTTRRDRLVMQAGVGLPAEITRPGQSFAVEFGEGHLGYVAEHPQPMDRSDFERLSSQARKSLEATPAGLRPDVVVPMLNENKVLGVITVGGARTRQDQEKALVKMVAQIAAVAQTHVAQLRDVEAAADRDGLTALLNKRAIAKRLGDLIVDAEHKHTPVSLFLLDIDHFKQYNDTNGHQAGDDVLRVVGRLLRTSIRDEDKAGRYGGEEFMVIFPGAGKDIGLMLADKLRRAVEQTDFEFGARQPLGRVTISGGVATYPEDALASTELVRLADEALYASKKAGRNRVTASQPKYLT
jgi:diguanylate cyclase (GGDEF)-like protein